MKPSIKLSVNGMRYIPIIAFALMFIHVIMLSLGIECPVCEILVVILGFYIAYSFSVALGFCLTHRLCIYYALLVMTCIWLRRYPKGEYGLFGDEYIMQARLFMVFIGSVISLLVICKHIKG